MNSGRTVSSELRPIKNSPFHRNFQEYFAALYVSTKVDEQQEGLCASIIRTITPANSLWCNETFSYSEDTVISQSNAIEFLKNLYYIEPMHFEYIALQPIRAKLSLIYKASGGDIFDTVARLFKQAGVEK